MKKTILFLSFCISIAVSSCKKDPENQIFIIEENVVGYIVGNIARNTKGLISETEAAAVWSSRALNDTNVCNYVNDSTFSHANVANVMPTFSFAQSYHTDVPCSGGVPTIVHFSLTHNGLWETGVSKGSGNGNGAWNISELNATTTAFKINGDYLRSGNAVDKKGGNISFSTDLRMKLKDVEVDKTSKLLRSGTITFVLTGASSSATDYELTGTITVISAVSARLIIGNKTYSINLDTGEII